MGYCDKVGGFYSILDFWYGSGRSWEFGSGGGFNSRYHRYCIYIGIWGSRCGERGW